MTIKRAQADTQCVMKWDKENQRIRAVGLARHRRGRPQAVEDLVEQAKVEIAKENADATTVEVPTARSHRLHHRRRRSNAKRMERQTGAG